LTDANGLRKPKPGCDHTVITQGVLGESLFSILPWYISSAHAALAQTFFAIVVLMALYTGRDWMESALPRVIDEKFPGTRMLAVVCIDEKFPGTRMLAVVCIVVLYLQLFFGACISTFGYQHRGTSGKCRLHCRMVTWTAVRVLSQYGHIASLRMPAAIMIGLLMIQLDSGLLRI